MKLLSKTQRPEASLEEEIRELWAKVDARIDALAKAEYDRQGGGVPIPVIRNILCGRVGECQCRQYLRIKEQS